MIRDGASGVRVWLRSAAVFGLGSLVGMLFAQAAIAGVALWALDGLW